MRTLFSLAVLVAVAAATVAATSPVCVHPRKHWLQHHEAWVSHVDTDLCPGGPNWLQAMQTADAGSQWMRLAHEWITARINHHFTGEQPPHETATAITQARTLLTSHCGTRRPDVATAEALIDELQRYNDGNAGVSTCDALVDPVDNIDKAVDVDAAADAVHEVVDVAIEAAEAADGAETASDTSDDSSAESHSYSDDDDDDCDGWEWEGDGEEPTADNNGDDVEWSADNDGRRRWRRCRHNHHSRRDTWMIVWAAFGGSGLLIAGIAFVVLRSRWARANRR
jgi:hypothetical protein